MRRRPKKDFVVFKNEIKRLIKKVGMGDWCIEYWFDYPPGGEGPESGACIRFNTNESRAAFYMTPEVSDEDILTPIGMARHEFGHLLIARMEDCACCRFITRGTINVESERFANMIDTLLS